MEEDGKKRHIYQIKPQRQEVLELIPDKTLKQHFQCMENSIQGVNLLQFLCRCCWTSKFKRVDPLFVTAFDELQIQQKVNYYRKYVEYSRMLAKKNCRLPETNYHLDDLPISKEMINIQYKMGEDKKWKDITITLDNTSKILESPLFRLDLHQTFVIKLKNTESCILLKSWADNRKDLYLKTDKQNFNVLFQRIQKNSREATEENIFRIIDGERKIRVYETNKEEAAPSERSLDQRINVSNSSRHSVQHTIKQVNISNFLKYRHPSQPLPKENQVKRLKPSKTNKHYFLEDDWEINSDGELVVVNQKKLQAQGSVIKYIIKRLFTGSKIFSISLPATVFNQQSNLSLLLRSYAHAPLELESASHEKNALKRFLKVIRFSLLGPCYYIRCDKPFNPILGQTYQALVNGTLLYGEQVSHHPPISSLFIKGRGYTAYGSFQAQLRFGANSAKGNNKGWLKISFDNEKNTKQIVKVSNIPGQMGGMLIGRRTLNMVDQSYYIDQENLILLCLTFGEVKLTKKKRFYDSVEGKIVKLKPGTPLDKPEDITQIHIDQELGVISGRWLSQVFFNEALLIDTRLQPPPQIQIYPALLPSDYSLRQDIKLKRIGADDQQCQSAKQKLEEIQRNDRRLREKYKK